MPMETKAHVWGTPDKQSPRTITFEVQVTPESVWRFHRDEQGRVWVRVFLWSDQPPGYWSASKPYQLSPEERRDLLNGLEDVWK